MERYSNRALIIIVALALILLLSIWTWVDPFPLGDAPTRLPYTAQTSFEGADLRDAILCETDLSECNLIGADLRGVDLTYRTKILKEQIEKAIIDETTKRPENLKVDAKKKS